MSTENPDTATTEATTTPAPQGVNAKTPIDVSHRGWTCQKEGCGKPITELFMRSLPEDPNWQPKNCADCHADFIKKNRGGDRKARRGDRDDRKEPKSDAGPPAGARSAQLRFFASERDGTTPVTFVTEGQKQVIGFLRDPNFHPLLGKLYDLLVNREQVRERPVYGIWPMAPELLSHEEYHEPQPFTDTEVLTFQEEDRKDGSGKVLIARLRGWVVFLAKNAQVQVGKPIRCILERRGKVLIAHPIPTIKDESIVAKTTKLSAREVVVRQVVAKSTVTAAMGPDDVVPGKERVVDIYQMLTLVGKAVVMSPTSTEADITTAFDTKSAQVHPDVLRTKYGAAYAYIPATNAQFSYDALIMARDKAIAIARQNGVPAMEGAADVSTFSVPAAQVVEAMSDDAAGTPAVAADDTLTPDDVVIANLARQHGTVSAVIRRAVELSEGTLEEFNAKPSGWRRTFVHRAKNEKVATA